jgi:site-specific DNA recombinase
MTTAAIPAPIWTGRRFAGCWPTSSRYLGKVRYKREIHEREHDAIVDADVVAQVQTLLQQNGRTGGRAQRNKYGALLRGLLRCAACDCGMNHSYTAKGTRWYRYYVCDRTQKRGRRECPSPSVPEGEIERFVVNEIKGIGADPLVIRETLAQARSQAVEQMGD